MINLEFPEPPLEDLVLVSIDTVRGETSENGVNPEEEVAPLTGRVAVGGPHGFKISAERVAADAELARFIAQDTGRCEYYFIHLAVSFSALGYPRLRSAKVEVTLVAAPSTPEPFALSLDPLAVGHPMKVGKKVRILPAVKIADQVELSLGDYEHDTAYERSQHFVRGLGLDGPTPGWEFARTPTAELEGAHRLAMIVQAGHGAAISVTGRVTAQVRGNIPWRFCRELPHPLNFAAMV